PSLTGELESLLVLSSTTVLTLLILGKGLAASPLSDCGRSRLTKSGRAMIFSCKVRVRLSKFIPDKSETIFTGICLDQLKIVKQKSYKPPQNVPKIKARVPRKIVAPSEKSEI